MYSFRDVKVGKTNRTTGHEQDRIFVVVCLEDSGGAGGLKECTLFFGSGKRLFTTSSSFIDELQT